MFKIFSVFKKRSEAVESAPATATALQAAPMTQFDWAQRRAPQFGSLSRWTRDWLQALPETVRPVELSVQHPHVANRLALSWRDVAATDEVLDDLLVGKRKNRKGFAPAAVGELLLLRAFHTQGRVAPTPQPASFDAELPQTAPADSNWARLRAPMRATDMVLSITAQDWLESMPRQLRPAELCKAYPRVVNRLAMCWTDPALASQLLDDLLIGKRGTRKGFPGPMAEELLRLRRFHESYCGVEIRESSVSEFSTLATSER